MKKSGILFVTALLLSGALIRATIPGKTVENHGIQFENITFNQALSQAQKEHKLIFLNVYATWCAPCKMLMKTTLANDEVGKIFNESFINISKDAEKGEGIELARKYQVQAHPIMFVINDKGQVVKRILGYRNTDQLLSEVKDLIR